MAAVSPLTLIFSAVDNASPTVKNLISNLKQSVGVVGALSLAYNQTQQAIASLAAQGQKAYDLLIGQNVQLQQQLLSTQASLASTNKVIQNGVEIKDPTAAVKALQEPVEQAIARIRQGSLELVGVTSAQLVPVFQVIAQQSSAIGASLEDSADLTLSAASAFQVLGIGLDQARQEISSIINQQITSDSLLAKSLNLNNEMIGKWKAQGTVVAELTKRLGTFRASNALASQTIEGVSSNLLEIKDEIFRIAGAPLLQPIVQQLNNVYTFLQTNKDTIQEVVNSVVGFFLQIGTKLGEAVTALQPALSTLAEAAFTQFSAEGEAAASVITILTETFVTLVKASAPLLQILADISLFFAKLADNPIGQLAIQAGILLSIGTSLLPLLGGIATGATVLASAVFGAAAAFTSAGGGAVGFNAALTFLFPAATAAAGGVSVLTTALTVMQSTVLPLTLAVVALGSALALVQAQRLEDVNESLEVYRTRNEGLSDSALKLASSLKQLNDLERDNGKLSEQEAARRKKLQQQSALQVAGLKDQIESIKQLQPANEEQKAAQQAQIAQLQRMISLLQKQSGGTKTVGQDIQDLGNDYEQLNKKVGEAIAQFNKPANADQFKASAKNIVDFTNKQIELGQVSATEAIAQLNRVRNDTRVELDLRLSAQQAITKIREGEVDKRVKSAENEQQKIQALIAGESISQAEGQRRITQSRLQQLKVQLDAVRASIAEEERLRRTQIETQLAGLNKQIAEAEAKRQEAESKGDKGGARIAGEELAKLQVQRASTQASLKINTERLTQLKSQQQKFSTEIAQVQSQEDQRLQQERLKDFDEQQQILESQNARRLISQEQFNQQTLNLTKSKGQAELEQIAEQRSKLSSKDKEGLEALAAREAAIRKQIAEATEKFEQQKSQTRIAGIDSEQKQLAASLAEGAVTQEQFNQQSLALTQQRLQAELDEVQRQRKLLKAGDNQRASELDAQEADIRKRSVEAVAQNQEQQLQLLEQAQKRATDAVAQSEADRQIEIAKFQRDNLDKKAEAEQQQLDLTRDRINSELSLEQDKLNALISLPPLSDPQKEESRQSQIRASRLKTAQLTKSLIDNEVQQRDAAFRVVETQLNREIQQIQNNATAQNQALEKEQQLRDFTTKAIANQITLLEARKNLISSVASFYEGELNVLKETTKNQKDQKQLAETAAQIRLNSARAAFEIEREITKQKIEQREAELAIKELQLQGEQSAARAATLKAQAEQKKVLARPGATQEEKDASALDVQAAQAKESQLQLQGALLGQERAIASAQGKQELADLTRNQQLQDDQNRLALANARVSKSQGKQDLDALQRDILRREGVTSVRDFGANRNFAGVGGELAELLTQLKTQIQMPVSGTIVPQSQFVGATVAQSTPGLVVKEQSRGAEVQGSRGDINININNEFSTVDATTQKAANTLTQQINKQLYDLGVLLTR